ncbi:unnamed protein product [Adineta steineri]|uniref:N-terminal methionine N(alpha)-acetyltransferase NatE n=1 Tax=Adineta steineri TaxID=433720 RepID=A0A815H1U4_9BILA|nr:unnamed protein product [Adineta steineri]CAF3571792.1 unnamed protein product [Adineta steineri]
MNILLSKSIVNKAKSSNIQVYHNRQFPLKDIVAVLYPLFGSFYQYDEFIQMIMTVHHIFCAYDRIQKRCVACALVNNTRKGKGLYVMLFGVRKSNQQGGVGTHLLKSVVQWAYRAGYAFIYLHVHVDNYKAIGLYEKVGFQKQEYLVDYYSQQPKENPDAYRMVLQLR